MRCESLKPRKIDVRSPAVRICLLGMIAAMLSAQASAGQLPYRAYTYTFTSGEAAAVYSPNPYIPAAILDSGVFGVELENPVDLFVGRGGTVYLLDKGTGAVHILDDDYSVKKSILSFINPKTGEEDRFNAPEGIYAGRDGRLYIADTQNSRIVVLDQDGKCVLSFTTPKSTLFDDEYVFYPTKIAADDTGRMYVISRNDFSGILNFNSDGSFFGYLGSNMVTFDPIDMLWKKIFTQSQRDKTVQFVPVEYTNLFMSGRGFIYTVSASATEATPVKMLNMSGDDVLTRLGYSGVIGGDPKTEAQLVDITAAPNGQYYILDFKTGRVFIYNRDGFMLYAFGALGSQKGAFACPVALDLKDDNLLVLDEVNKSITVFEKTDYAREIGLAEELYNTGKYEQSKESWFNVVKANANFDLAYAQIGKILLMEGKYREAMDYFILGNLRGDPVMQQNGYNKAFSEYRKQILAHGLPGYIIFAALLVSAAVFIARRWRKGQRKHKNEVDR